MEIDPGGPECPPAGQFVTISYESSTDTSSHTVRSRKRPAAARRVCKKCNKKIKKNRDKVNPEVNCLCCSDSEDKTKLINIEESRAAQTTDNNGKQGLNRISRLSYTSSDSAPFVVHIQKELTSTSDSTKFHPVEFGRFLKNNNIKNIDDGSLKTIGRNRLSLSFSTYSDANNFINNENLGNHKYKAFIPSFQVCRVGLVRGIPADWSDDDILANITLPIGCGDVIKVRRIKKKCIVNSIAQFNNTESVVFTFDGQTLPKRVFMCYNSLPVDLYIYPTIQCYNCCRYGHVKTQCRSTPRCFRCGQGHSGDNCSVDEESLFCCLCQASHIATSKNCPEFQRQKLIKESMAHKCLSYAEASKLHPPVSKFYSDVLMSHTSTSTANLQKQNFSHTKKSSNKNITESYKKTVFREPRSPPKLIGGYDKNVHYNLIKDYNPPLGGTTNGSALPVHPNNNVSVPELIQAIINFLTQSNIIPSVTPSNVATINSNSPQTNSHYGLFDPVELS